MKVTAVVLNWKRPDDTVACVRSLRDTSPGTDVIVVDNASGDGSAERIRMAFQDITLIENEANLGYAGGNNMGIRAALAGDAAAVFVLNNDAIVRPACVEALALALDQGGRDIVGPVSLLAGDPEVVDFYAATVDLRNMALVAHRRDERGVPTEDRETDYVTGSAMLLRRSVLERHGLFDERFFLVWEDVDLCLRSRNAAVVARAQVLHGRSASFGGEGSALYQYFYVRNSFLIARKHLGWLRRRRTRALLERRYRGWLDKPETTPEKRRAIALGLEHGLAGRFGPPPPELAP